MTSDQTSTPRHNFILQQGLPEPEGTSRDIQYSALLFQPRVVAAATLFAVVFRSATIFFALAAVLWWSALLPRVSPFDALYNAFLARRSGHRLEPAPAPRRFAQGMAGTFSLAIGLSIRLGWNVTAFTLEALFAAAIVALVFGGFCLGSFVYHLLAGRGRFARETLPWARRA